MVINCINNSSIILIFQKLFQLSARNDFPWNIKQTANTMQSICSSRVTTVCHIAINSKDIFNNVKENICRRIKAQKYGMTKKKAKSSFNGIIIFLNRRYLARKLL